MATEIKNAEIMFVSLVDKAANKRKFAIIKSDEGMNFEKNIPIIKKDEEKQIVTGVVYAPDELDSQNEFMAAETIEKAAHKFMTSYRNIDKQHNEQNGYAEVIESWIAKEDGKIGEQSIKKGTWLASVHVTDTKIWEQVKKGDITGFSMGGMGERIEHKNKVNKEEDSPEMKGFFNVIKNFFSGEVSKADAKAVSFADRMLVTDISEGMWRVNDALRATMKDIINNEAIKNKVDALNKAVDEYACYMKEKIKSFSVNKAFLDEPIEKAGRKISGKRLESIKSAAAALNELIAETDEIENLNSEGEKKRSEKRRDRRNS